MVHFLTLNCPFIAYFNFFTQKTDFVIIDLIETLKLKNKSLSG